ncbi:MAG TPA: sugar ABC transporter permease [Clostridiales bacterium]|nr:sugar ABC transporter permease [Clostridiales bacterium]
MTTQIKARSLRVRYNRREVLTAMLFLIPTMVLLVGFCYYPAFNAVKGSFYKWDGFNDPRWVGVRNYTRLFKDDVFILSLKNVFKWAAGSIVVSMTAPLIGALMIFSLKSTKTQYWYRVAFVLPMVVPTVVTIKIWTFIYEPNIGILNTLFRTIGLDSLAKNWLGETALVIPSLIFVGFPWVSGFNLLIYYAGLQNIPTDVLEYAEIDGCTNWRKIFHIELPLITGQIKLLLILGLINTLQNITLPLLMTNGGPGYDSYTPGLYMYFQAFRLGSYSMANTIATVMFVIIMGLTILSTRLRSKVEQ